MRSPVVVKVISALKVETSSTTVKVESTAGDLVENDSTMHTDLDRSQFQELPLESVTSSVSSLVTLSSPGISADSNGLFHGLGDHASNSFSIDGQPITDQHQQGVFEPDSFEFDPVAGGDFRARHRQEYGGKTALVISGDDQVGARRGQAYG